MSLAAEQCLDLVRSTENKIGKGKFTDLASSLQSYVAMSKMLRKNKVKWGSGTQYQFQAMVRDNGSAKNVGLFAEDNVNYADVMETAQVPWRHTTANSVIEDRMISMNSGPEQIVDIALEQRAARMLSLAGLMEENWWGKPTDSSDKITPWGVPMWIVKNTSETSYGLNGGNPSGFSDGVAGLDSDTYAKWKNGACAYTDITKADLIRKMREAYVKSKFIAPFPNSNYDTGDGLGIYTTYRVLREFEEVLESQNDRLGSDLASMDGKSVFRRVYVEYVPYLEENDTSDPVYGINWGVFKVAILKGEYLHQTIKRAPNSHRATETHVDISWNTICFDRRKNWVLAKA